MVSPSFREKSLFGAVAVALEGLDDDCASAPSLGTRCRLGDRKWQRGEGESARDREGSSGISLQAVLGTYTRAQVDAL